jgi:hypothetical protein
LGDVWGATPQFHVGALLVSSDAAGELEDARGPPFGEEVPAKPMIIALQPDDYQV